MQYTDTTLHFPPLPLDAKYRVFVFDIETKGFQGIPLFNKRNEMIQLSVTNLHTKETFQHYCKPVYPYVTPENFAIHRISKEILETRGVDTKEVLSKLDEFLYKDGNDKQIIMVAHNCAFDCFILMKEYLLRAGEFKGFRGFENSPFIFFDSLEAMRELYPELTRKYWPTEKPFKLETLMAHFFPYIDIEESHNADFDVKMLCGIFTTLIFPKLPLDHNEWKFSINKAIRTDPPCNKLVRNVTGFGDYRVRLLYEAVFPYFHSMRSEKPTDVCLPFSLIQFSCRHLQEYAFRQYKHELTHSKETPQYVWSHIVRTLETLMRTTEKLTIHSDTVLVEILAAVCNLTTFDLVYCAHNPETGKPLFPSMPGDPISYFPLNFNEEDAKYVCQEMQLRTFNEIYADYKFQSIENRSSWIMKLNSCIRRPLTIEILEATFSKAYL